jgi:ABC-type Fe3+ transport system substrate-binding protein
MEYFTKGSTLWDITENYPQTISVFSSNGFQNMEDPAQREKFAKSISLQNALMLKQINYDSFAKFLVDAIESKQNNADISLANTVTQSDSDALNVVGLLPCPVRIPLLEQFNTFIESYKKEEQTPINYELKAASMGLDWVEQHLKGIKDASKLPDLFISAGFDMFFDEKMIGQFKKQGVFKDTTGLLTYNSSFDDITLKDPAGHYSMIGVVPAVFLINLKELGDLPLPQSWEDILDSVFENRISLPVGDFDLFNAILLNIHKMYGDEGIAKMGNNLLESMHPSQMVKSDRKKNNKPIITIMPYFFTKMVKEGGTMKAVWPKDGAILSPIFMLSKKDKQEKLQPVIDFFASKPVGEILSHSGLFPSVHPEVDNHISKENKFMWLGWDYIYANDISGLIAHCESVFNNNLKPSI